MSLGTNVALIWHITNQVSKVNGNNVEILLCHTIRKHFKEEIWIFVGFVFFFSSQIGFFGLTWSVTML